MSVNMISSQNPYQAKNANEASSPSYVGMGLGLGATADLYNLYSKNLPNKYSKEVDNLKDAFTKISQEVEPNSAKKFQEGLEKVAADLETVKKSNPEGFMKRMENPFMVKAHETFVGFKESNVLLKENASQEAKDIAKAINAKVKTFVNLSGIHDVPFGFNKASLSKITTENKYLIMGLAAGAVLKALCSSNNEKV